MAKVVLENVYKIYPGDVVAVNDANRDGVPELRALPAHDRLQEHGVRVEAAAVSESRD